jgi:hypothetical protein
VNGGDAGSRRPIGWFVEVGADGPNRNSTRSAPSPLRTDTPTRRSERNGPSVASTSHEVAAAADGDAEIELDAAGEVEVAGEVEAAADAEAVGLAGTGVVAGEQALSAATRTMRTSGRIGRLMSL